ncbi:MAG: hypothetical protein RMK29_21810 [Myxococcales bacterium]|nr:hypothetical protein [Myxococcales bacterium]
MSDPGLLHHHSVSEYFHEVVSEALRAQGVEASAHAEFYLVNLLSEYSHATLPDEPLSILLLRADESEPHERLRRLREIGDHSLYLSGFFAESLERRCIDVDYYISIGGTAYGRLARSYTTPPWSDTYRELSAKFAQLVDVLSEVALRTPLRTNSDLLQLYERYLRTGSSWTARRLRRHGLGVIPLGRGGSGSASA